MNNTIKVTVSSPLLRPGLVLETTCSEKYAVNVLHQLMNITREFNNDCNAKVSKDYVDPAWKNIDTKLKS